MGGTMDSGGSNNASQTAYRFRADDGDETAWDSGSGTGASYLANLNIPIGWPEGDTSNFRVRVCAESSAETISFHLERKKNSGSWIRILSGDGTLDLSTSSEIADGHTTDLTTWGEELSSAAWADTDNNCLAEDPTSLYGPVTFASGQDKRMEVEVCLAFTGLVAVEDDVFQFRLTSGGQIFSGGYVVWPTITITAPVSSPARQPYPYQQRVYGPILRR
jgi:hypothetical protein